MKRKPVHEPLVNIVARKLGHAAGTLAAIAHLAGKGEGPKGSSTELDSASGKHGSHTTRRGVQAKKQRRAKQKATRARSTTSSRRSPRKKRPVGGKSGRRRA